MKSLIREQQSQAAKAPSERLQPRIVRKNPVKVMLRWIYWLLLIGVVLAVLISSLDTGLSLYRAAG